MKLRANLLRVVLFILCMGLSAVVIVLTGYFNLLDYKNSGLAILFLLTLLTTYVVIATPEYIKEKYNLR